ncbi:hypothetical protein GCM10028804_49740 [Larkinella terrae]
MKLNGNFLSMDAKISLKYWTRSGKWHFRHADNGIQRAKNLAESYATKRPGADFRRFPWNDTRE